MPISSWQAISDIMAEVVRLNPKSVLDLGCGFGLYGALCRNYLDAMHGRCQRGEWGIPIFGIEAFERYRNPAWDLYHDVEVHNFTGTSRIDTTGWGLVLMIDSLEHLYPEAWRGFLDRIVNGNKHVIVSVPNGLMEQGAAFGNEYERHRTTFQGPEFDCYEHTVLHLGLCRVVSISGKMK